MGQWKGDKGLNNAIWLHFLSFRKYSAQKHWKSTFSITPLSFDAPSPGSFQEYPHKPYIARIYSHWTRSSSAIVWVYLHSNFCCRLWKTHVLCSGVCNGCPVVQGDWLWYHSKARMQLPVGHGLGPILPRFRNIAGFLLGTATPPQFNPNFGGVPLADLRTRLPMLWFRLRGAKTELIIRLITFELTQLLT